MSARGRRTEARHRRTTPYRMRGAPQICSHDRHLEYWCPSLARISGPFVSRATLRQEWYAELTAAAGRRSGEEDR